MGLARARLLRWPTFVDEFDLSYGTPEFHQEALSALDALIAKRPESPLLARRLSLLYAAAQRWDDALALEARVAGSARTH